MKNFTRLLVALLATFVLSFGAFAGPGGFGRSGGGSSFGGSSRSSGSGGSSFGRSGSPSYGGGSGSGPSRSYGSGSTGGSFGRSGSPSYGSGGQRIQTPSRTYTTYRPGYNRPLGFTTPRSGYSVVVIGGRSAYYYPGYGYSYAIGGPVMGYYDPPVYGQQINNDGWFGGAWLMLFCGLVLLLLIVGAFRASRGT